MIVNLLRAQTSDVTFDQFFAGHGMTLLTVLVTAVSICVFGISVQISAMRHNRTRRRR